MGGRILFLFRIVQNGKIETSSLFRSRRRRTAREISLSRLFDERQMTVRQSVGRDCLNLANLPLPVFRSREFKSQQRRVVVQRMRKATFNARLVCCGCEINIDVLLGLDSREGRGRVRGCDERYAFLYHHIFANLRKLVERQMTE